MKNLENRGFWKTGGVTPSTSTPLTCMIMGSPPFPPSWYGQRSGAYGSNARTHALLPFGSRWFSDILEPILPRGVSFKEQELLAYVVYFYFKFQNV